jgi:hypothetical protein
MKENSGRVHLSMMYLRYCKNIYKHHNVPPLKYIKKKKNYEQFHVCLCTLWSPEMTYKNYTHDPLEGPHEKKRS